MQKDARIQITLHDTGYYKLDKWFPIQFKLYSTHDTYSRGMS